MAFDPSAVVAPFRMQPGLRVCWQTYVDRLGLDRAEAGRWLPRAVRFAGARLVQTAMESSLVTTALTSLTILHLQVGHNVLERPGEAAVHLLGLPAHGWPS